MYQVSAYIDQQKYDALIPKSPKKSESDALLRVVKEFFDDNYDVNVNEIPKGGYTIRIAAYFNEEDIKRLTSWCRSKKIPVNRGIEVILYTILL